MSDLLKRLRNSRKSRVGTKVYHGGTANCPIGEIPINVRLVDIDYYTWDCVPDPNYIPPTPTPVPVEGTVVAPSIAREPLVPNVGMPVSDVIGARVPVENILRMRVQMGDEYGKIKGWYSVKFPKEVSGARVLAASGPRSAIVPRSTLVGDRRENYIIAFSDGVGDAISVFLRAIIPNIGIDPVNTHYIIRNMLDPMATEISKIYGQLIYDFVVKPSMDITTAIANEVVFNLTDSWGIERGRSVHNVDIRKITTTSFEWYSYGEQYINWVAIGMLPPDEDPALPPELSQPIDNIKGRIDTIEQWLLEIIGKIDGEVPATERKRILKRLREF